MRPEAEVYLLQVQDSDPGFMWSRGGVLPPSDVILRQRVFAALGRTVRGARVDCHTPGGRVVWGRQALVVEAPLAGTDSSGRALRLTVVVVGDTRDSKWHSSIARLACQELSTHGFQADRAGLEQVLAEAQHLRPNLLRSLWLDLWHEIVRIYRLVWMRLSSGAKKQHEPTDSESLMEDMDENS